MLKSPKGNLKAIFSSFWRMYTLFFVGAFFMVFFTFIFTGRTFIWSSDASGQYMPNLYEIYGNISDAVRSLFRGKYEGLATYSYHAGVGSEISQNYCKGILEYIGFFFKRSNIEITFTVIIALRIYLAGISFGLMSMYFKNKSVYTVPGAIMYAFNGFSLYYGMRHVTFLIPMVMLPLMVVGLDLIQKRKTPVLFIFTIAYSGWNGYYFLYMNTIFVAVYTIATWFADKQKIKKCWGDFWRIVMYYIVGASVAAVSLFPRLERFFLSTRAATTTKESGSLLFYGKTWFGRLLVRLFSPYTTSEYTKHYMLYAVTPLVVLALVALFILKFGDKEKRRVRLIRILFITGVVFLCIPVFGYIFSGFSSQVNRWNYGFVLVLSYTLTVMLPRIFSKLSSIVIGGLGVVVVWGIVLLLDQEAADLSTTLGLGLLIAVVMIYLGMGILFYRKQTWRKWVPLSVTVLTVLSVGFLGNTLFNKKVGNFASQFLSYGDWKENYDESLFFAAQAIDDTSFYRVEVDKATQSIANAPKAMGINGTSLYDSATSENNICFSDKLLNADQPTSGNFYGYDSRFPLEAVAGVKYYITSEEKKNIPFGFRYLNTVTTPKGEEQWIYISKLPTSLGRVYTSFATEKEIEGYSALQKQEMMLDTVILDHGEHAASAPDVSKLPIKKLNIRKKAGKNGALEEDGFRADEAKATYTINFSAPANSEIYVQIKGLNVDEIKNQSMSMSYSSDFAKGSIWATYSKDKYRLENYQDFLIYLGYTNNGKIKQFKLTFPQKGKYYFEDISVYSVSRKDTARKFEELSKNSLQNTVVGIDKIESDLSSNQRGVLMIAIPYNANWEIKIDGHAAKTFVVDYMWTGVWVEAGQHHITMVYNNELLKTGICLTISGIIMTGVIALLQRRKRNVH